MSKKFYTQFSPPPKVVSPHGGKSLTDASAMKDTDINTILRRHNIGDNSAIKGLGVFADVSKIQDFATNLDFVRRAKEDFAALPSALRDRFGNDARSLVAFLCDSSNDEEAIRLGLKVRSVVEKPIAEQIGEAVAGAIKSQGASPDSVN